VTCVRLWCERYVSLVSAYVCGVNVVFVVCSVCSVWCV